MEPKPYETLTLRQCTGLLKPLMRLPEAAYFLEPVDPEMLRIPDYFDIIKAPMDLGTVNKRLEAAQYRSVDDFIADVRLVWKNAYLYNKAGHAVHTAAKRCESEFEEKLAVLVGSGAAPRVSSAAPAATASDPAPERVLTSIKQILKALTNKPEAVHFRKPFDWKGTGFLQYPLIVTKPMDLSTASKNLEQGLYKTAGELRADVDRIWQNCIDFNGADSWIGKLALTLRSFALKKFTQVASLTSLSSTPQLCF